MNFLEVRNLKKQNNNFILDIDIFKIVENKINIIFGENGAGKTTLLNCIIDNKSVFSPNKKILLTQQSYTFNRTCEKNIEMVKKWNKSEKSALEFLEMVDLVDKKDEIGKNLSGGQKKRLSLAMALATDAEIILLDEPFANIDAKNQKKLIDIIKELENKKTIVIVSHRIDLCRDLGDYFIKLEDGGIVKAGIEREYFDLSSFQRKL